jgi:hypothetical protein
LGAADICLVLIMQSVLVEPVVKSSLEINVISEIAGTGRSNKEMWLVGN